jgi:hypothetical protein
MIEIEEPGRTLLTGPLIARADWPLNLRAQLCDLRPRFLAKSCTGAGYRRVSRNGKILLCADRPIEALIEKIARVRLQTWHRSVLPGERPEPFGLLLCVRLDETASKRAHYPAKEKAATFSTRLVRAEECSGDLQLDVGGEMILEFCRPLHEAND